MKSLNAPSGGKEEDEELRHYDAHEHRQRIHRGVGYGGASLLATLLA